MGRIKYRELWKQHIAYSVTKLTLDVVQKLEQAFSIGATIEEACDYADISSSTYYNWVAKYPELLERFQRVRQRLTLKAKQNLATLIHSGDPALSKWLVEKFQPEKYGERLKVEHSSEVRSVPVTDETDEGRKEDRAIYEGYLERLREARERRALEEEKFQAEKQKTE